MQMGGLCVQYYPGSLPEGGGGGGGGRIILQVKLDLKIILLAIAHIQAHTV